MLFYEESGRIYAENENGKVIAEIVFPEVRSGVCEIMHTYVDASLRGRGIAGKLMTLAVAAIEREGKTVTASCSYAVKWLSRRRAKS
ncbi:GNAT family N-acetyltransferase [Mitsuokella multacida]|uniref:GNAT family N-acetyltransferase n=1 Tax=Mitsuokella multacida TaxID=52226 RepID=UPI00265A818F|nr:GNAT family N-acetyltransferase [Mitsuokella multacida]